MLGDCRTAIRELEGLSKLVTIIGEEVSGWLLRSKLF